MLGNLAVGDLVRREFGTLRDGLERVEPGSVWFTKPDEPRFVTVELTVVPLAPVGGWNVRVTRLLGHDWRVQVGPPRLVEQLEAVLATRQVALASAKLAAGCERAVSVEAAPVFPPERRAFWTFHVVCQPGEKAVRIDVEDDGTASVKP
jgi:hypothetical protein